jgi:hypothetical protein
MLRIMKPQRLCSLLCWLACWSVAYSALPPQLSSEQQSWLQHAHRFDRAGWIYLHVEGDGRARGFQHGYLLAREIADSIHTAQVGWEHQTAMPWSWVVKRAAAMFVPNIDPENLAELGGLAEGVQAAGLSCSRDEMVAYNGMIELSDYWWPDESKKLREPGPGPQDMPRQSCSSFIATGSLTSDGNIVLGHNTMEDYCDVLPNVIEDIVPAHGHRIFWQTCPGWIHSGTDFFITDAGLVGSETTIGGFDGFDSKGVPEFARMRRATQDAGSIEQWCDLMKRGNNGGYANAWLLGDINTREIARLELGLKRVAFEKKRDGYFCGSNVAEDLQLLRFETTEVETDISDSSVARRVRWKELLDHPASKINLDAAKRFEGDHFDTYRGRRQASGRTLCGHFELDPEADKPWPGVPYGCAGTVDAKAVDAAMARKMSFTARWGSGCGTPFSAKQFLQAHPQFDWMTHILKDRPSEPWTDFRAGE